MPGLSLKKNRGGPKSGFTMVEMMVALVIAVIVIGISGSLIITSTNLFSKAALQDRQVEIAEAVLSFVTDRFLYAHKIETLSSSYGDPGPDMALIQIVDPNSGYGAVIGQLVYRRIGDDGTPVNVFGSGFYQEYLVSIEYAITRPTGGGASIMIAVNVHDGDSPEALVTRSTTKPILNYTGNDIEYSNSKDYILIEYLKQLGLGGEKDG